MQLIAQYEQLRKEKNAHARFLHACVASLSQRARELEQAAGLADLALDEDPPASVDGQLDPERADDADCSLDDLVRVAADATFSFVFTVELDPSPPPKLRGLPKIRSYHAWKFVKPGVFQVRETIDAPESTAVVLEATLLPELFALLCAMNFSCSCSRGNANWQV